MNNSSYYAEKFNSMPDLNTTGLTFLFAASRIIFSPFMHKYLKVNSLSTAAIITRHHQKVLNCDPQPRYDAYLYLIIIYGG